MLKNKQLIKPAIIACAAGLIFTACASNDEDLSVTSTETETYTTGSGINESSGSQQQASSSQSQALTGNEVVIPLHEERINVGKRTVDAGTVTIRKIVTTETVNQPIELRRETLIIDREGSGAQSFQSSTSSQRSTSSIQDEDSSAGVSAQAGAGQSGASVSAQAGGTQAEADIDADADADAELNAQTQSGAGVQAQADFDQSEPAGATTRSTTAKQSSSTSQSYSSGSPAAGNAFQEQTYTIQLREEQPVVEKNVVQTGQVVARKNSQMQRQSVQREIRREDVQVDQGANSRNVELRGDFNSSGISDPSGAQSESRTGAQDQSQSYQSETEIRTETQVEAEEDRFEDKNTLDDINRGSNTRGGAEDLQNFDERSQPKE